MYRRSMSEYRRPERIPGRHPRVSLSDQLTTIAGWSHTPQADRRMRFGFIDHTQGKDIYKLCVCSYPSIGVKPSPSQEVRLLAKDFFPLLLHPCQLQEWIHLATNLHFYAWKSSFQCQDQDPILYLLLNHREVVGPPPGCCSQVIQSSPAGSRPLQSCLMIYFFGNHGSVIVLLSFH